jgi:hypothetical protein
MKKYTVIYTDSWMSGSRMQTLVQVKRIQCKKSEPVVDALKRLGLYDQTVYLFEGWPKLQGEEDASSIE